MCCQGCSPHQWKPQNLSLQHDLSRQEQSRGENVKQTQLTRNTEAWHWQISERTITLPKWDTLSIVAPRSLERRQKNTELKLGRSQPEARRGGRRTRNTIKGRECHLRKITRNMEIVKKNKTSLQIGRRQWTSDLALEDTFVWGREKKE